MYLPDSSILTNIQVQGHSRLREILFEPIPPASVRAQGLDASLALPVGFDEWFARCVIRDPAVRYPNADEAIGAFVGEWAEELEGYEDLHASAALRRDLFRNLGPHVIAAARKGDA